MTKTRSIRWLRTAARQRACEQTTQAKFARAFEILTEGVTMHMAEDGAAVRFCSDVVPDFPEADRTLVAGCQQRPCVDGGDHLAVDRHFVPAVAEQPDVRAKAPGCHNERQPQQHQHHDQAQQVLRPLVEREQVVNGAQLIYWSVP